MKNSLMQRFISPKLSVTDNQISMLIIAIVIGILGGYGAVFFRFVIKLMQYLFYRNSSDILTFAKDTPFYILIGMPALGGLDQSILRTLMVSEFMSYNQYTIPETAPLPEVIENFRTQDAPYLHLVDKNNRLTGIISFRDIRRTLGEENLNEKICAGDVATRNVVTVTPSDHIQHALRLMSSKGISQLPVVSEENGRDLLGALREKDLMAAYDKAVLRREIEAK